MSLAAKAITWLVRGFKALRANRKVVEGLAMTVFKNNTKIAKRVERFFEKIAKVERMHGEHTEFWGKIKSAHAAGVGVSLDAGEVKYAAMFKRGFDDTLKPIGVKLAGKIEPDDVPLPDVEEIPDLDAAEDDDSNLAG